VEFDQVVICDEKLLGPLAMAMASPYLIGRGDLQEVMPGEEETNFGVSFKLRRNRPLTCNTLIPGPIYD
jgi:hypothetical protein